MRTFSGDQIAQVNNPDPFAVPVWRSPVYHTPSWIIVLAQLWRLLAVVVRFAARQTVAWQGEQTRPRGSRPFVQLGASS